MPARHHRDRDRILLPLLPEFIGTGPLTSEQETRLGLLALDWLIREHLPAWLDLSPSLQSHAAAVRALAPIESMESATAAGPVVRAALDAARAAALDAARAAALDAARAAARAALRPTRDRLIESATVRLRAMCALAREMRIREDPMPTLSEIADVLFGRSPIEAATDAILESEKNRLHSGIGRP